MDAKFNCKDANSLIIFLKYIPTTIIWVLWGWSEASLFFLSKLNKQVFISQILSDCLIFTSESQSDLFVSIGFWLWLLDHNSNSVTHTWFLGFSTVTLSNWLWLVLNSGLTSKPKCITQQGQSQKDCWSVVA